ncbi:putative extracellular protein [Phytophthora megakarya]|uniref:Putative extracellular protein n=1 Tax=Phytophthora megakarya TaxID=4795 RepID=A0A225VKL2_9STRA|nr:putative extracellular protein [Phytophthora megakarya]
MATDMEQQRAPELAMPEPESSPRASSVEENKPVATLDVSRSGLAWPDPSLQPLRTKPTTPGGSTLKVETSVHHIQASTVSEPGYPKPSDGLPVPNMTCDSVSPVSPTVMKDLQFDSRFISDAWSYEAPQNMYALLTHPTNQMDPLAGGTGVVTPYMQLQAQHQQHLQLQQQQLEHQLDHGLPLQLSPIHGSGLSSLYMSGGPMAMSPHQMLMQQPPNGSGVNSGYPSTPTAMNLSDIMISGDPSLFLVPSSSPTNLGKQHMAPPISYTGGVINVKDLTLNELRPHFNKPMTVVAKELGVCITLMKKICRRNGLVRWPHRRIRSLVNRITSLQVLTSNAAGAERKRFQGQITSLREELSAVIQNPNERSRKAQVDTKIPIKAEQILASEIKHEFPIAQITEEMVGPAEISADDDNNDNDGNAPETIDPKKCKEKKSKATIQTETKGGIDDVAGEMGSLRSKKRKPSFGLHAHQPPPIKIPRHDELPAMSRLRSQSVPERRLRGDRRHGRGREAGAISSCVRPSTTTHRNGRRGSISSILNDIAE